MVLLLSVAYSPLAIYAPLFLQRLHGLKPLAAGYMVAEASLAWTTAALTVASLTDKWPARLIVAGPVMMSVGLLGVAAVMGPGPVAALLPPIALIGIGIGQRASTGAIIIVTASVPQIAVARIPLASSGAVVPCRARPSFRLLCARHRATHHQRA